MEDDESLLSSQGHSQDVQSPKGNNRTGLRIFRRRPVASTSRSCDESREPADRRSDGAAAEPQPEAVSNNIAGATRHSDGSINTEICTEQNTSINTEICTEQSTEALTEAGERAARPKKTVGLQILRRQSEGGSMVSPPVTVVSEEGKRLRPLPGIITLTKEADSITYDEEDFLPRAKMQCGHVYAPETMTQYVKHILSQKGTVFRCPAVEQNEQGEEKPCEALWDYQLVRHVACFTEEEKEEVEKKLGELYLVGASKAQQCPRCQHYCIRENNQQVRVCCTICSHKNSRACFFCWACLHVWRSKNDKNCGNEECSGEDPRLRYLRNAEKKRMGYTGLVSYAVRACPQCGFLIHHTTGCKQMQCYACKVSFCFVCLKTASNGEWRCGMYNTRCEVAPIQTKLAKPKD